MELYALIQQYHPTSPKEESDQKKILSLLDSCSTSALTRDNLSFHFTASAFVMNPKLDHVLMVYHQIYQSWSWPGGHADGNPNLESVARKEVWEETGLGELTLLFPGPVSLDLLSVGMHRKKERLIASHQHISVAYAFTADDTYSLSANLEETKGVRWIPLTHLSQFCSEPHMLPIYLKIIRKIHKNGGIL